MHNLERVGGGGRKRRLEWNGMEWRVGRNEPAMEIGKCWKIDHGCCEIVSPVGDSSVGVRFVLTKWANGSFLFDYMGQWELLI